MAEKLDEPILDDHYPVHYGYWYLLDGEPRRSEIGGTVCRLKQVTGADEVRRCDIVGRGFIK